MPFALNIYQFHQSRSIDYFCPDLTLFSPESPLYINKYILVPYANTNRSQKTP